MTFTDANIHDILNVINVNHVAFIANNVGSEVLSDIDKALLQEYGINIEASDALKDAYSFGLVSGNVDESKIKDLDYKRFKEFADKYINLTPQEQEVFKSVQRQAYKDIKGLGNRISAETNQMLIEADKELRAKKEGIIRSEAEQAILNRETTKQLASRLGNKLNDWKHDMGRIADFLMHSAFEEGRGLAMAKKHGMDVLVYKSVYEGACSVCREAYLTNPNDIRSEPIIYKLSELIANGSNIGKKKDDWKPVLGSIHPWCRCLIHRYDKLYAWNPEKRMFNIPKEYVNRVKRESTVKYRVNGRDWRQA